MAGRLRHEAAGRRLRGGATVALHGRMKSAIHNHEYRETQVLQPLTSTVVGVQSARPPRPRFTLAEASGAIADLGVLLPILIALISLNHMNATSALVGVGVAYVLSGLVYRLPIPVQPLKSFASTALALGLSVQVIIAGAWWMAAVLALIAALNLARPLGRLFPRAIVRGIQLGLGALLVVSAWKMVFGPDASLTQMMGIGSLSIPWTIIVAAGAVLILVVTARVWPNGSALTVVAFGAVVALVVSGAPHLTLAPRWPGLLLPLPSGAEFAAAFVLLVLPQVPLTLANAVFSTSDAAEQYFHEQAAHVTPRRLTATMAVSNVLVAAIGGVPVCHGCGGLTAHYRMGARTGGAPLMLGAVLILVGVLGGQTLLPLLRLIPLAALGVLLGYIGVLHMLLARDLRGWRDWVPALVVAGVALAVRNLGYGFAAGLVVYLLIALATRAIDRHRKVAPAGGPE